MTHWACPFFMTVPTEPDAIFVREVRRRRERLAFVKLPWRIYAHDSCWVPPLIAERMAFIHPGKHPFYRHGAAVHFLAYRGCDVVGRITASDDPHFNEQQGTNTGCFGLFESIDDERVARALLHAAADWLRARGRSHILGPVDYSTNYMCGLLVDGFETPPVILMNHHPRYYARLLETWGLSKARDLYQWSFTDPADMASRWARKAEWLMARGGFTVRSVRMQDYDAELDRIRQVYNRAWEENWGFVKMTDAEFKHMAREMKSFLDPELVLLAEAGGTPVGFALALPNLNEALAHLNGRLTTFGLPIGLVKLVYHSRRLSTARMLTLGVVKPFRRRGVSEMLVLRMIESGMHRRGYRGELGWTLEDNRRINNLIRSIGGDASKIYRLYEKSIGP